MPIPTVLDNMDSFNHGRGAVLDILSDKKHRMTTLRKAKLNNQT